MRCRPCKIALRDEARSCSHASLCRARSLLESSIPATNDFVFSPKTTKANCCRVPFSLLLAEFLGSQSSCQNVCGLYCELLRLWYQNHTLIPFTCYSLQTIFKCIRLMALSNTPSTNITLDRPSSSHTTTQWRCEGWWGAAN